MYDEHGGDWAGYETEYGAKPIDFSANISPFGMPDGVKSAAMKAVSDSSAYPDPLCRAMREAIGEHFGFDAENILCGSGAADIIYRLTAAVKAEKGLITAPAFSEYRSALVLSGAGITEYPLKKEYDFIPQEDILEYITEDTGIVFMCEPSNPAGTLAGRKLLTEILDKCSRTGTVLAVDECFNEFLDEPGEHTMLPFISNKSLVIIKAFTKFYGMAGLRAGYCISSNRELLGKMSRCGAPWNVSTVAQACSIAALKENEYEKKLRETIKTEREYLYGELSGLGLDVIPGKANFLLFMANDDELQEKLKATGILIRSCGNYSGLSKNWYRVAVKLHDDNIRLISALREVLHGS